jgi:hypothetical protein
MLDENIQCHPFFMLDAFHLSHCQTFFMMDENTQCQPFFILNDFHLSQCQPFLMLDENSQCLTFFMLDDTTQYQPLFILDELHLSQCQPFLMLAIKFSAIKVCFSRQSFPEFTNTYYTSGKPPILVVVVSPRGIEPSHRPATTFL